MWRVWWRGEQTADRREVEKAGEFRLSWRGVPCPSGVRENYISGLGQRFRPPSQGIVCPLQSLCLLRYLPPSNISAFTFSLVGSYPSISGRLGHFSTPPTPLLFDCSRNVSRLKGTQIRIFKKKKKIPQWCWSHWDSRIFNFRICQPVLEYLFGALKSSILETVGFRHANISN